jgi:GNAT superfamily N-acetyltransferase
MVARVEASELTPAHDGVGIDTATERWLTHAMIDGYSISTDKSRLDLDAIHAFLSTQAAWSLNIPKERVRKSIEHSRCYGVYHGNDQVGFARVISDLSTIAYLGDVYILEAHRGRGLAKWLVRTIMNDPELQGLRRWILLTADAHGLYRPFGWKEIADPSRWMEIHDRQVYSGPSTRSAP